MLNSLFKCVFKLFYALGSQKNAVHGNIMHHVEAVYTFFLLLFFLKTDHSKQFTVMFEVHVQNQSVSVLTSEYFKGSAKKNATSSGHICYG